MCLFISYVVQLRYIIFSKAFRQALTHATTRSGQSKRKFSPLFVKIYAQASELYHRLTKKPILVTNELAHLMAEEYLKSNFSFAKTESELGGQHRPLEESLADVVDWYRKHGYFAK